METCYTDYFRKQTSKGRKTGKISEGLTRLACCNNYFSGSSFQDNIFHNDAAMTFIINTIPVLNH